MGVAAIPHGWFLMVPSDRPGRRVGPCRRACLHRSGGSSIESPGYPHPLNTCLLCSYCMRGTGLGPGETLTEEELCLVLVVAVEKATEILARQEGSSLRRTFESLVYSF